MKLKIKKNILLENLNYVIKGITNKTVIPILNGIKFELTKEGLYLTGSDSELTIKSFIETKDLIRIEEEGNIIIQSKNIIDIIRKMPSEEINMETIDDLKIKIFSSKNEFNLNCLSIEDYPSLKIEESKNPIILSTTIIKELINQTCFAISTQESRPLLTGINFKINGNILECIATDSYRLAKKCITLNKIIKEDVNIVVPGKNLLELDKIIEEKNDIELHIFNNKLLFKYKNILFQTNLLSGTYPNTNNLIPTDFENIINVNYNNYFDAIDRAAIITQSKEKNIVKMSIKNKKMQISSFSSEIGKVEENISIDQNKTDNFEISFSAKYMLEALKTLNSEDILILLNSDIKPIIIKSTSDESLIQLILPIKTY